MMKEMRGNIICSLHEIILICMGFRTVESLHCSSEAMEMNAVSGSDDSDEDNAISVPHDSGVGSNKCSTDKKKRKRRCR